MATANNTNNKVYRPIDVPITLSSSTQNFIVTDTMQRQVNNEVVNVDSDASIDIMLGNLTDNENQGAEFLQITNTICTMVDDVFMGSEAGNAVDEDRAQAILALLEEEDVMCMNSSKRKKTKRHREAKKIRNR